MAATKRYIISPLTSGALPQETESLVPSSMSRRRARSAPDRAARSSRSAAASDDDSIKHVKDTNAGRRVVEMNDAQALEMATRNPNVAVEEDHPLHLFQGIPGLPDVLRSDMPYKFPVRVVEAGTGRPIPNATLFGMGGSFNHRAETDTDENGVTVLGATVPMLSTMLAAPREDYWSKLVFNIDSTQFSSTSPLQIELTPLMLNGDYDWGHKLMGFPYVSKLWTGRGVRIGVVDTGIASSIADVHPAGGFNTLDGEDVTNWDNDLKGHGTHCAGIAAALANSGGIIGGAPDAEVFALRVFPGGFVSDLVQAVEWCIENEMDVLSMSLGMPQRSQALALALNDAHQKGITVVAATGNDSGPVAYPAAFPSVVAVGALGAANTFPTDSQHILKIGQSAPYLPGVFAGSFSNYGPEVAVCAPGIAILSTVPTGYAAWDGTSMACPMVSALVALILEAYPDIRTKDSRQSEYVRALLNYSTVDLGLPAIVQGRGLPFAPKILPMTKP